MHFAMDFAKHITTKPPLIFTRPLTWITSTIPRYQSRQSPPPPPPPPPDSNKPPLASLLSILTHKVLDSSKCKTILPHLTSQEFERLFFIHHSTVNLKTTLDFFRFASTHYKFRFTVRSNCLLIRLLLASNHLPRARFMLKRLIDGNVLTPLKNLDGRLSEIASSFLELNRLTDRSYGELDLLLHILCSQFQHLGFHWAFDIFTLFTSNGVFPSLKTCNFLMSSLVRSNELHKSYRVFDAVCRGGFSLDVYTYATAINAFSKGGKVDDAVGLFFKMEEQGVLPNVVTYNNLIDGLCKSGRLEEAFRFKDKMVENKVNPSLVTYGILVNGLMKAEKFDEEREYE
ncbi:hypothetical protein P8452_70342 [Trifolium repens]|nr:hypothetical protein P8452_70342 [Trifolium repens]